MIVYDVIVKGEVKETITPTYSDLVSLYYIMRDIYWPQMVEKYGPDVKLKRRFALRESEGANG